MPSTTGMRLSVASGRGVADRWRSQYQHPRDGWSHVAGGTGKDIHEKLCALGANPDPDAVAEVIGNKSWAHLQCSGCGQYVRRAVDFTRDYANQPLLLCADCVTQASAALADAAGERDHD